MPDPSQHANVDLGALLTIDVSSELRKLSSAQLEGPWQIAAEVARRALRGGARRVDVEAGRGSIRVTDSGTPIAVETLRAVVALLDPRGDNAARHAALTRLEQGGGLALLAIVGLERKQIDIQVRTDRYDYRLRADARRAVLERNASSAARTPQAPVNEVRVSSPAFDRRQVCHWLGSVARFSNERVWLDGKPIRSGFTDALAEGQMRSPFPGVVALPNEGETSHVWLLEHGIITGHLTVPDAPCFEAAIEMGSAVTDLSAARLRDAATPQLGAIIDSAVALACHLGGRAPAMSAPQRSRTARFLIAALRRRVRAEQVATIPMFRALTVDGPTFASLAQLRASCVESPGGTRALQALYPSQNPKKFALGDRLTLVADATERSGLAEVLSVRYRAPNPRDASQSFRARLRRQTFEFGRMLRAGLARIRHPMRARPLDDAALTQRERAFLEVIAASLSTHADIAGAHLCEGAGPVLRVRTRGDALLLPRRNPLVIAALTAIENDAAWAYPVVLALVDGHRPSPRSRAHWHDALAVYASRAPEMDVVPRS